MSGWITTARKDTSSQTVCSVFDINSHSVPSQITLGGLPPHATLLILLMRYIYIHQCSMVSTDILLVIPPKHMYSHKAYSN